VGHVACMGDKITAYRTLVGKPEGKRPFGRPRRRREDNITISLSSRVGNCGRESYSIG